MHRPKATYETQAQYDAEMMLNAIIAEEKRVNAQANNAHFQLGYLTSFFAEVIATNPGAKRRVEQRLEYMKTLKA